MTVYFNRDRGRWVYNFTAKGVRHHTYALDAAGAPVASRSAALQAEGVARRAAELAPRLASARDLPLAQVLDDLSDVWMQQASWTNRQRYVEWLLANRGAATPITAIDDGAIADITKALRTEPTRRWHGGPTRNPDDPANARFWKNDGPPRAPATINLYLDVVRAALVRSTQIRDPVTRQPAIERAPKVPALDVPKRKARPIPDAVLGELFELLPRHAAEAEELTLYFGFRRGEVFGLRIENVDFDARGVRLWAEAVKDEEDTFLPAAPEAMRLLDRLVQQARDRGVKHLITWRRPAAEGKPENPWLPIKKPKSSWTRAMNIIQAKHGRRWRWHDIRAAFITHVALTSGAVAAQALARHSEYETTQSYVEVADELRRRASNRTAKRPALKLVRK